MRGFKAAYRNAALTLLNTVIFFAVINVIIAGGYAIGDHIQGWRLDESSDEKKHWQRMALVHPDMTRADIEQMHREHEELRQVYSAFAQFKEAPVQGRFLNVHDAGFRMVPEQGPWPPVRANYNIFLFGGSTMFGYGVRDIDTIAHQLQKQMSVDPDGKPVKVYNFGRGGFYSSQERALFNRLVIDDRIPDVVIFMDGFNDVATPTLDRESPTYTPALRRFFNRDFERPGFLMLQLFRILPIGRLAADMRAAFVGVGQETEPSEDQPFDERTADHIIRRYRLNAEISRHLAGLVGARSLFIWQPVPEFRYDLRYHLFADELLPETSTASVYRMVYERLEAQKDRLELGGDLLWLADIQKDEKQNLYCDSIHYNAVMNRLIAQSIAERLHA